MAKAKAFASAIVLTALITPALADTYWVILDPTTHRCSVTETKFQAGDAETQPIGAIGSAYQTQDAAEGAIQGMVKCGVNDQDMDMPHNFAGRTGALRRLHSIEDEFAGHSTVFHSKRL